MATMETRWVIIGKVYPIVPDLRAAKDALVRVIGESGEDLLVPSYTLAREDFSR
jgi:hypothetical protein